MVPLIGFHLFLLHEHGSSNPLGVDGRTIIVPFFPYYVYGDLLGIIVGAGLVRLVVLEYPYVFAEPLNYEKANPLVTPLHIKPEWYFLAYYALLRRVPRKRGGILVIVLAMVGIVMMPLFRDKTVLGVINYVGRPALY